MNILFYRYNSICEPDVIEAFERKGHAVDAITVEMENKDLLPRECLEYVSSALKRASYDMVFSINFFPVIAEVCRIFRTLYVCWTVDCPVMELYSDSIQSSYNRVFLFDRAQYEEFLPRNPECIFYLPLGANVERVDKVIAGISEEDRKKYSASVSFIGSLYTEKCPYNYWGKDNTYLRGYLDGLIEAQLKVYGYNFLEECVTDEIVEEFKKQVPFYRFPEKSDVNERAALAHLYLGNKVTEQERLRLLKAVSKHYPLDLYTGSDPALIPEAHMRGLAKSMTEMPKIFHLSKINLNFTSKPIRTGIPQRVWDILAAGGFVLTNYQEELPEYFTPGEDLEVYVGEEDLVDKIGYYLLHEEERARIAWNGYEKARKQGRLDSRIERMLQRRSE